MTECVFCRIASKLIPASIICEDEHTLAFMDLGQVNPGHVLVATKPHVENVFEVGDALSAAIMRTTVRVARASRAAFQPPGMTLFQANGLASGQTVFHFHMHVLPRWENDGMSLVWPVKNPPRETLQDYCERIRTALD
jgi:histidine triad (HIT) family protein